MDDTAPKYSEWLSEYTFDNCAVGRKAYGEFLASFLAEEKDGFVLNLNGKWGTGKTEFLKRLYTHFHNANHPVIYIDAWESDFTDNPLLVVASELINQLSGQLTVDGSDLDKLKEFLGKFLKGSVILAGSMAGKFFLDDAGGGRELVKALYESSPKELLNFMKKGYSEQVTAVNEVRSQLEHFAEALKKAHSRKLPVVVLVDELDRCRPNYAIEMLEVIKHFFNTKNFVFVVATDTEQLQNSINAVYGEKFESEAYLRRFFDRKSVLSPPDVDKFLGHYEFDHHENVLLYPDNSHFDRDPIEIVNFKMLARAYSLGLRDIDQLGVLRPSPRNRH
ncbi:AAA family ATPase [Alteromonadaceae bacterium A_SAG3]|nr:AAA family ATPase [Alteromonadaceae bacterium A_SAG3]NKX69374.1 AAA family ATPase [Alteromonadaceae bacterium A_SAG7]